MLLPGSQFSCWARVWQGPGACLPWQGHRLLAQPLLTCSPAPPSPLQGFETAHCCAERLFQGKLGTNSFRGSLFPGQDLLTPVSAETAMLFLTHRALKEETQWSRPALHTSQPIMGWQQQSPPKSWFSLPNGAE